MIRAVLFDIDDTLLSFSSYVREAMRSGFAAYGLKPYAEPMFDVFTDINGQLWREIERGTLTFDALQKCRWNRIFDALGIDFDGEVFEAYFRGALFDSAILEPGALDLLAYLQPKYALCVASNGPARQQRNRLRVGGLDGFFSHCFISEEIGASKPDAAFFDHCFRTLRADVCPNLTPDEAIIVGDSPSSDIAGGARCGMHTCLYKPGAAVGAAEYVVSSFDEIRNFL